MLLGAIRGNVLQRVAKARFASFSLGSQGPAGCARGWEGMGSEVLWFGCSHSRSSLWLVGITARCFGIQQCKCQIVSFFINVPHTHV